MSTFDWLFANEYPLLLLLFVEGMVPYGYGDVRQVPVASLLFLFQVNGFLIICFDDIDIYAPVCHTRYSLVLRRPARWLYHWQAIHTLFAPVPWPSV